MNISQTKVYKYRWFIGGGILLILMALFVYHEVFIKPGNEKKAAELEARNKYLESQNYKDSLYRVDTVHKTITLTNERIIYNTKIYEKIIHKYDSATAREHEEYYRTRYGSDTPSNLR